MTHLGKSTHIYQASHTLPPFPCMRGIFQLPVKDIYINKHKMLEISMPL